MHFTPLGQTEIAAPTGLISSPLHRRRSRSRHFLMPPPRLGRRCRANHDCFHLLSPSDVVIDYSNLRTSSPEARISPIRAPRDRAVAQRWCNERVWLPFYESKFLYLH
jgi:hypothetical protein